jgi:transposase
MQSVVDRPEVPSAIRNDLGAIFVSLELSRSTWLITSLSPGGGEKMSKHSVRGGGVAGLLERFAQTSGESSGSNGSHLSDHRHSGSGVGRFLDPSCASSLGVSRR